MTTTNPDERKAPLAAEVLDELEACAITHQSVEDLQALEEFPNSTRAASTERARMLRQFPAE
jgi:hypothetical protein